MLSPFFTCFIIDYFLAFLAANFALSLPDTSARLICGEPSPWVETIVFESLLKPSSFAVSSLTAPRRFMVDRCPVIRSLEDVEEKVSVAIFVASSSEAPIAIRCATCFWKAMCALSGVDELMLMRAPESIIAPARKCFFEIEKVIVLVLLCLNWGKALLYLACWVASRGFVFCQKYRYFPKKGC